MNEVNNLKLFVKNESSSSHPNSISMSDEIIFSKVFASYLQHLDKNILEEKISATTLLNVFRTLKLAYHLPINESKIIVTGCPLTFLIQYRDNGKEMIIDYLNNLVMDKDLYCKKIGINKVYNILGKNDLYKIGRLIRESNNKNNIFYYLIFSKEIFSSLGKYLNNFKDNFDSLGINLNNYAFIGNNSDSLFFDDTDCNDSGLISKIDFRTSGKEINKASIYDDELGKIEFRTLSSLISEDLFESDKRDTITSDINDLLSTNRYQLCHYNSKRILLKLNNKYKDSAKLVAGKISVNEFDYVKHSWIEMKYNDKDVVLDYNHNLVIDKDIYYRIYGAIPVEKTTSNEYSNNLQIINDSKLKISTMLINYFGKEIANDLKKNVKIFTKKI